MVSIGNFRNQQLYLGATNRNLYTAKATLQANTGAAKFRPSGKTATFKLTELTFPKAEKPCNTKIKDTDYNVWLGNFSSLHELNYGLTDTQEVAYGDWATVVDKNGKETTYVFTKGGWKRDSELL